MSKEKQDLQNELPTHPDYKVNRPYLDDIMSLCLRNDLELTCRGPFIYISERLTCRTLRQYSKGRDAYVFLDGYNACSDKKHLTSGCQDHNND